MKTMTSERLAKLRDYARRKRAQNPILADLTPCQLRVASDYAKELGFGLADPLKLRHCYLKRLSVAQEAALCQCLPHGWRKYSSRKEGLLGWRPRVNAAPVFEEAAISTMLHFLGMTPEQRSKYIRSWAPGRYPECVITIEEAVLIRYAWDEDKVLPAARDRH